MAKTPTGSSTDDSVEAGLTKSEIERYSRQLAVPGWSEAGQRRLKRASVGVAGAGGLGSAVLMYLVAAGVGRIVVVDKDRVSLSNLNRQVLHWTDDVGRAKTESASEKLANLNPEVELQLRQLELTDRNIDGIFDGVLAIVDCLDNFPTRYVLNDCAMRTGTTLVHGAVWGMEGRLTVIVPGQTPCLSCLYPDLPQPELPPVCGATAALVGSLQATEIIKGITGIGDQLRNELLVYDGTMTEFTRLSIRRDPVCVACSDL